MHARSFSFGTHKVDAGGKAAGLDGGLWLAENLNDQNLDEAVDVIGQSSTTTVDTNGNTADKIAHADCDTRPEEGISGVVGLGGVELGASDVLDLLREDDGHDDAVDGDDLTEDNGDQVLGSDAGGLNTTTENRRAGNEDAPVHNATNNGETDTKRDTQSGPGVRRNSLEESTDIEGLAATGKEHVYTTASSSAKVLSISKHPTPLGERVSRTSSND
ncbi:hypothetical protein HG530_010390 [Fusarium avenaceum]|nr:hypothetical protein HG530_010390 [Fusarium avenaceum]